MADPAKLEEMKEQQRRWEVAFQAAKKRDALFATLSGIPVELLYTPLALAESDYLQDIGMPGDYPYLRGIHPSGFRGRLWTMRMFAGFGTAEQTNARYKYLLEQGETGL
ncbi:MAG: methylmalonyl-CoA mutase family protein, partial [Dehalococcoidia bacterium]